MAVLLLSLTGAPNAALDLMSDQVAFNAKQQTFQLQAKATGAIAGAANVTYVSSANTGSGTNTPFAPLGLPRHERRHQPYATAPRAASS